MNLIHSFERSAFAIGTSIALSGNSAGATRTRVVRQSARRSIDRLIEALASERRRADELAAENAELRRRLEGAGRVISRLSARATSA